MAPGRRRERLDRWLQTDLLDRFVGRIVPVDRAVAQRWGALRAAAGRSGHTIPVIDSLIAATALIHSFAVVMRNVRDFAAVTFDVIDPWTADR